SMNETSRFIRPLLEFLFPAASPETLTAVHGIIRKFAHLAEYAVLGFLAFRVFAGFIRFRYTSAIALVLMVAAADEINQSFDPSRTSSIVDVGIDLLGGIMAVLACAALSRHVRSAKPGPGKSR
ncbi:MAG: VanZ family protein, partial [Pyrinomonadaceae bacterium]